ncbi:MAG: type II secretion system protein [Pseudomonadota bacterium]
MRPLEQRGFTLIELVVVIVILGILAALAIPRFLNLDREARIASLNGLAGALGSAASTGQAQCALSRSTCQMNAGGWSFSYFLYDGKKIYTHYGIPTGWGKFGVNDGKGSVGDMVALSEDYQYMPHVPASYATVYQLKDSPDPTNCKLTYKIGATSATLTLTVTDSGC